MLGSYQANAFDPNNLFLKKTFQSHRVAWWWHGNIYQRVQHNDVCIPKANLERFPRLERAESAGESAQQWQYPAGKYAEHTAQAAQPPWRQQRPAAGMIAAAWEQSASWDYVKNVYDASPCKRVLTFVERRPAWSDLSDEQLGLGQADGGVTAETMWKDEENDRKWWWRRGGGKMGSISSAWLSASKRSRVSDCSKWQIKGPFMLLHKCSLRTGCETERRVCAVVQLSRSQARLHTTLCSGALNEPHRPTEELPQKNQQS